MKALIKFATRPTERTEPKDAWVWLDPDAILYFKPWPDGCLDVCLGQGIHLYIVSTEESFVSAISQANGGASVVVRPGMSGFRTLVPGRNG